jgi:hypothetical protein
MSYDVLCQTAAEVADVENAPRSPFGPYLFRTEQTRLLRVIRIYAKRGDSREQLRLLYMNAPALALWRKMGKAANVVARAKRPPPSAILAFGVPFSE